MKKALTFSTLYLITILTFSQVTLYDSHIKNGLDYYRKGLIQQAINEFQLAHSLDSNRVESYYYSGVVIADICYQSGQSCDGAIEMLTTSINIDPAFRKAYYNRGVCLLRVNYLKEALQDFNEAIKLDPTYGNAYCNRGLAKIKLGDKTSGCQDIEKGIKLNSELGLPLQNQYCK